MKFAYIIMAYNKPEQLIRLVERLKNNSSQFVIHFDKNGSNDDFKKLKNYFSNCKNIHFTRRIKCYWGDFSLVQASMECIKFLIGKNINFDYAILLSGQDYPLVSTNKLESFFERNKGKQYLQYFRPVDIWKNEDRIDYFHFNKHNNNRKKSIKNFIVTKLQNEMKKLDVKRKSRPFNDIYGGSQWWCLSKECLEYILKFTKENKKINSFFKYTHIPDELFFQTIVLNSSFKGQVVNDHLRYIDWSSVPAPKTLDKEDFQKLISSNKLFARKFDEKLDQEILDMIDQSVICCSIRKGNVL